jgi:hypothetical protein
MPEYEYTLMYEPRNGTPVSVPSAEVQARLNEGFRTAKPDEDTVLKPGTGIARVDISPSATIAAREMVPIEINAATLKDLQVRLGLSTAYAKLVKEKRPYTDLEDLIAKVPEINNWANLEHIISFKEQEQPKELEQEKAVIPQITQNQDLSPTGTDKATPVEGELKVLSTKEKLETDTQQKLEAKPEEKSKK